MRFAIFSDIHANLQAWEAVLADIRTQGADTLVCLGDVVGYGPTPGPVLESVYQFTDNFVLGNHDAVVGGRIDAATFNEHAQYVIKWTADQLGDEGAAFFAQVPLTLRGEKMLFTHGDAARPGHFDYVVKAEDARRSFQSCKDEVIFFGHTHEPGVFACANNKGIIDKLPGTDLVLKKGRRYMINPGSVGDPRSASDLRGSYCLYDDTTRRLSFRKVEFDIEGYRADLEASGLEMEPYFLRVIDAGSRRPEEDEELAIVQDHREEVEVDESMTAQPRALVTVGSPMANRPKLHFGYAHPQRQIYASAYPMPQPHSRRPQTRPIHQMQGVPNKQSHSLGVLIVGIVIGIVGLVYVLSQMTRSPGGYTTDLDGEPPENPVALASHEDGWEEPDKVAPEPAKAALVAEPESEIEPVFSLSSLGEKPFETHGIELPDGVKQVESEFGGQAFRFGAGAKGIEILDVDGIDFGGSISVAAWIKIKPSGSERVILARGDRGDRQIYLNVTPTTHKYPGCVIFGGVGVSPNKVRSSSKKRVDNGLWHFVMGMHDKKEGKLRIYVDGVISKSANSKGTFPVFTGSVSVGDGDFNGDIYGLCIYDWPLHTKDMLKVYRPRE